MVPRVFTTQEIEIIRQTVRVRAARDLETRITNLMGL